MKRRDTIANVSGAQRRRWLGRAVTIQRKAAELMDEALGWVGEEHPLTDYIDNVIHQADDLVQALRPQDKEPSK